MQPVGIKSIGEDVRVLAQDQGWGLTYAAVCTSPGGVLSPQTPNARLPGRGIPPGAHKAAVPGPLVTGYVVRGETYPVTKAQAALYFKRTKRLQDTSKTQVGRWILEWHSELLNVTNALEIMRENKEVDALK